MVWLTGAMREGVEWRGVPPYFGGTRAPLWRGKFLARPEYFEGHAQRVFGVGDGSLNGWYARVVAVDLFTATSRLVLEKELEF